MTKFLDGNKIQEILQNIGDHDTNGRSQSALKAAPDGLSRVDSDSRERRTPEET